jgi:putative superfamily III holin-X
MEQHEASATANADDSRGPLAALLSQLFRDAETLLLRELVLFRVEVGENAGRLVTGALVALAGLLIVLVGVTGLLTAVTILLSYILPLWLACALVGFAVGVAGALLVIHGRRLVHSATLVPQRTLRSLRETRDWIRAELT